MKIEDIRQDAIYVGDGDLEDVPGFIYIRGFMDGEIGFSVLDDPVEHPDFSESGIFWIPPEIFCDIMRIYSGPGSVVIPTADKGYC